VLSRLRAFVHRHRQRLARLALVLVVLGVGGELVDAYPRPVDLLFVLGPDHASVRDLRVAYVQQGHELHVVQLRFAAGAPGQVPHRVQLGPGRYELRVELGMAQGAPRLERRALEVPADGTVRVDLGPPGR
jgi:hypothetical protein